jgi:hypothetical protein
MLEEGFRARSYIMQFLNPLRRHRRDGMLRGTGLK